MDGRFIQKDPSGFADGVNLYVYVQNNPINWTDPKGLQQTGVIIITPMGPGVYIPPVPIPMSMPPKTIPTTQPPWEPNDPLNLNPTPGDKFSFCMATCQAMFAAMKCPRVASFVPCAIICTANAFGGGPR